MTSNFFQKARERAQEAAQQLQERTQGLTTAATGNNASPNSAGGSGSGFAYTGAIPHFLRQSVAQYTPRHEASRQSHLLSTALKSVSIDHEATARETKKAAVATFKWGQDQSADKREDGAGDEALVDVADRLAYMLQLVADLESAHVKRLEEARSTFKRITKAEDELASRREKRVKIHRELAALVPERARGESPKIKTLEDQLKVLEQEDTESEEAVGLLKRQCLKDSYEAHFDSLIELGEKLAVVGRHGKLLTHQLPVHKPPFPAPKGVGESGSARWPGAEKTASIRAAAMHALEAHQPSTQLPDLALDSTHGDGSLLNRADTASYAVSHKEEIDRPAGAEDLELTRYESRGSIGGMGNFKPSSSGVPTTLPVASSKLNDASSTAKPPPESPSLSERINNAPSALPPVSPTATGSAQAQTKHRVPPLPSPPTAAAAPSSSASVPPPTHETDLKGELAEGPTVAETGAPITGPGGPSSGQLKPRKPSVAGQGGSALPLPSQVPVPPRPAQPGSSSAESSATGDARRRKEAEANEEAEQAEVRRHSVNARLRRDNTVVRRGEHGWEEAEAEELPPYHE